MHWFVVILVFWSSPVLALAESDCLSAPYTHAETAEQHHLAGLLAEIRVLLAPFPALTESLERFGPALCLADQLDGAEGYLDPEAMAIVLRRNVPRDLQLGILLHELRHLDQFGRGFCPSGTLTMQENARAVFAMEADASAISLLVAWEGLMMGQPAVWEALLNWPSQNDIAIRLAQEFFRSADPATMAAEAFAQWYARGDRRERYYVESCSAYLDRQDAGHALPGTGALPDEYLERLCLLPQGGRYFCAYPTGFSR